MNDNQVSDQPVETKTCSTCKKPIEVSKFRIHEIGCARNNYVCAVCGDLVAKAEKEEHDKEAHTKVACQYCKSEFEKRQFAGHEDSCFMRPQECRYCEQVIKYEDYERHVKYCGSKTKKCTECGRNICLKDEDSHQYGGECKAYKEEDLRMRIEEAKRQEEEKKRKEQEKIRQAQIQKQKEKVYEDNFNMDDIDNERGGSVNEKLPRTNQVKEGRTQLQGLPKQTNVSSYMGSSNQSSVITGSGGFSNSTQQRSSQQQVQLQARIGTKVVVGNQSSGTTQIRSGPPQQLNARPTGTSIKNVPNPLQQQQQQQKPVQQTASSGLNRPGTRGASSNQLQRNEEQKYSAPKQTTTTSGIKTKVGIPTNSKQIIPNKGPVVNNKMPTSIQSQPQPRVQPRMDQQPSKQAKLIHNQQPLANIQLDPNEELIARLMDEEDDIQIASELQQNFYAGGNPESRDGRSNKNAVPQRSSQRQQQPPRNRVEEVPQHEMLIPDARQNFGDEWGMDEHALYDGVGAGHNDHLGDEDYQKVIEESLRAQGARNLEEEMFLKAIKESQKNY
ncbi:UNKNOWN [Stylonychia lemnae]|uniref:Uncharacterized protein n=1 Tax=Stylonychia lemnae TaxID=5949 RepID=A0A078B0H5_STYLE|nr:UNKNOWN [Stylonychia lemnae]|eukprot:CDW86603.1 UNKNOWN [Stylonychia lemnae]